MSLEQAQYHYDCQEDDRYEDDEPIKFCMFCGEKRDEGTDERPFHKECLKIEASERKHDEERDDRDS